MDSSKYIETVHTAKQLMEVPKDIGLTELVRGRLVVRPFNGMRHGQTVTDLFMLLTNHVREHDLGEVFLPRLGYWVERDPDTVLAPDLSFLRKERLPDESLDDYVPGPPDIAIEVLENDHPTSDIAAKVAQYLGVGVPVVWLVDPRNRTVTIYREQEPTVQLGENDTLTEPVLLPGFETPVAGIFLKTRK